MNTRLYRWAAILAAAVAVVMLISAIYSHTRLSRLEKTADELKTAAAGHARRAERLEASTNIYKEKAAYLESSIRDLERAAKRHDEKLATLSADTDAARSDLERYRRRTK